MHTYIHTYLPTYLHTYIHTCLHTYTHTYSLSQSNISAWNNNEVCTCMKALVAFPTELSAILFTTGKYVTNVYVFSILCSQLMLINVFPFIRPWRPCRVVCGVGWSSPRIRCFTPGKETRCPLYRRRGEHRARCGRVRKISPLPGFEPRTVQPVGSRCCP